MKKIMTKLAGLVLGSICVMQMGLAAFAAPADDLFIDGVVKDGSTNTLAVANYGSETKTVQYFTASYQDGEKKVLTNVDVDSKEIAANAGATLSTEATTSYTREFIWNGDLQPLGGGAALKTPTSLTGPDRNKPDEHRTAAYKSFILEWDVDTTGVVDHYEVYEGTTKLGETEQGYYIVYDAEINATKDYSVIAVSKGGKKSAQSAAVSAGSLYMNEIDFSGMDTSDLTEESNDSTVFPNIYTVNYPNLNSTETFTKEFQKYATIEDVTQKAHWIDSNTREGIKSFGGMKMFAYHINSEQYNAPVKVAADTTVGRDARGAYKTYYTTKNNAYGTSVGNYFYFYLNTDLLKQNDEYGKTRVAYDYLDTGVKIESRIGREGSGTDYAGDVSNPGSTKRWVTQEYDYTNWSQFGFNRWLMQAQGETEKTSTPWRIGLSTKVDDAPKLYISGARAWLVDRMTTPTSTLQMAQSTFLNVPEENVDKSSITVGNHTNSKNWGEGNNATLNRTWMTLNNVDGDSLIGFNVNDDLFGKYDKKVTIEFDYYTSAADLKLKLLYDKGDAADGTSNAALNKGTGTAKITLTDAGFANGLEGKDGNFDFAVGLTKPTAGQLYIQNIKVYPSTSVR